MADEVRISQSVAILIDGNNLERSIHTLTGDTSAMINFDTLIPKLLVNRGLNRLIYFREGKNISSKLAERMHANYHGSVVPCHKSADIPLSITATQIAQKVDTIIILSGDSDYVELVRHLKSEGVRVEIAAVKANTARILVEEADYFIPIDEKDCFMLRQGGEKKKRSNEMKERKENEPKTKTETRSKTENRNKKQSRPKAEVQSKTKSRTKVEARHAKPVEIQVSEKYGKVKGLLLTPSWSEFIMVLGHGAGAGMTHPFMEALAVQLAEQGIGSLRYNFPYIEKGRRRPDSPAVAQATILAATNYAKKQSRDLILLAGGKSFGGRMTSQAAVKSLPSDVEGLVFYGFPLHPAGKPGTNRAEHLSDVTRPMLFLQGTRDQLAKKPLMETLAKKLDLASLRFFEGADHSFKMLKRAKISDEAVIEQLAKTTYDWASKRF